jgi:hypothetical protein
MLEMEWTGPSFFLTVDSLLILPAQGQSIYPALPVLFLWPECYQCYTWFNIETLLLRPYRQTPERDLKCLKSAST